MNNKKLYLIIVLIIICILMCFCVNNIINKKVEKALNSINYKKRISGILIKIFGNNNLNRSKQVSNQLVNNFASYKQLDYLIKYFGLIINDDTVANLTELKHLIYELESSAKSIGYRRKVLKYRPSFKMWYISSGGRSCNSYKLVLSSSKVDELIININDIVNKKSTHIKERNKLTPTIRDSILARDNFTCCKCGNSVYKEPHLLLEVDHIIPISLGGKTEPNNLQTLCWKCNRSKSNSIGRK